MEIKKPEGWSYAVSGADRWINCPRSVSLAAGFVREQSDLAAEGDIAHLAAEYFAKSAFKIKTDKDVDPRWTTDMVYSGKEWANLLAERAARMKKPKVFIENKADMSFIGIPTISRLDAMLISKKRVEVWDYKYGQGLRVGAEGNPQLMMYGMYGLNEAFKMYGNTPKTLVLGIYQPRMEPNLDMWETSTSYISDWATKVLIPAYKLTAVGEELDATPGPWCRFCEARAVCVERLKDLQVDKLSKLMQEDPGLIPVEDIPDAIRLARSIAPWLKALEDTVRRELQAGAVIPGLRLGYSAPRRTIADPESLKAKLTAAGLTEAEYMKPPEMRSLTELEKTIGKARFARLAGDDVVPLASGSVRVILDGVDDDSPTQKYIESIQSQFD